VKKVLFVHAYAVEVKGGKEVMDPFMKATCDHVMRVVENYDLAILIGGWHTQELGENRLLGEVAFDYLRAWAVPEEKLMKFRSFDLGCNYMPTRSTEEEIILIRTLRDRVFGEDQISVCMVDYFAPKALWYYDKLGMIPWGLELVHSEDSSEKALRVTKALLDGFLHLMQDPGLVSEKTLAHLASRTLGEGYTRPDPTTLFVK
jgi:hypothetical protein